MPPFRIGLIFFFFAILRIAHLLHQGKRKYKRLLAEAFERVNLRGKRWKREYDGEGKNTIWQALRKLVALKVNANIGGQKKEKFD
jgi:hypothetical protein